MNAGSPGILTEDGHPVRITTEFRDILLHPSQRHHLVFQAVVAGNSSLWQA
jgi:hypothetical protein